MFSGLLNLKVFILFVLNTLLIVLLIIFTFIVSGLFALLLRRVDFLCFSHAPLEACVWSGRITLMNVTMIRLNVSVSRLLNLLLRRGALRLCLNNQGLASISRWITASSSLIFFFKQKTAYEM